MKTTINNELIRSFTPCYDPNEKIADENETLTIKEWCAKYDGIIPAKDMLWLLLRNDFFTEKDLRLFSVWCAREALSKIDNPDPRSIAACDVAERYAYGEATEDELSSAFSAADFDARSDADFAALSAADSAAIFDARFAADFATRFAARSDARSDARFAAYSAARSAQLSKLLTFLS